MALVQDKRVNVVDLVTGANIRELDLSALSWSTRLNKYGELSIDCPIGATGVDHEMVRTETETKRYALVLEIDNVLEEGGQIVSRTFSEDDTQVSLIAPGLWRYLELVQVYPQSFNPDTQDIRDQTVTYSNMSLRGIAGALLMAAANNASNAGKFPPVVCEFAGEAGTHTRTYNSVDGMTLAEALTNLTQVSGGPDISFRPEWANADKTHVRWRLLAGSPLIMQEGAPYVLDHSVVKSEVEKLSVDEDGTGILTRIYLEGEVPDNSEEASIVVASNNLLLQRGYPLMEVRESSNAETNAGLAADVNDLLTESSASLAAWTLEVNVENIRDIRPGTFIELITEGMKSLEDGTHLVRAVGVNGDHKQSLKLHVLPTLTTWANFDASKIRRRYFEPSPIRASNEKREKTSKGKGAIGKAIKEAVAPKTGTVESLDSSPDSMMIKVSGIGSVENWTGNSVDVGDRLVCVPKGRSWIAVGNATVDTTFQYADVVALDSSTDSLVVQVTTQPLNNTEWATNYTGASIQVGDRVLITRYQDESGRVSLAIVGTLESRGGGGGGGAAAEKGIVNTAINEDLTATITIDSVAYDALNYAGRLLAEGDDVVAVTDTTGNKLIVGKGLSADGTPGSWGPVRVSLDYPLPTGEYNMASGENGVSSGNLVSCFEDTTDALGYGANSKYIDFPGANNLYPEPATGTLVTIPTPSTAWSWTGTSYFVYQGVFFQWFNEVATGIPYLFRWDKTNKSWVFVEGLPYSRSVVGEGYWTLKSVRGEPIGNLPTVAMITADPSAIRVPGTNSWYYQGYVQLWRVTPDGSGWVKSTKFPIESGRLTTTSTSLNPMTSSTQWYVETMSSNNGHYHLAIRLIGAPYSANNCSRGVYLNSSDGMTFTSGKLMYEASNANYYTFGNWFEGATAVNYNNYVYYRTSKDGALYYALAEKAYYNTYARNLIRSMSPEGAVTESVFWDSTTDPNGDARALTTAVAAHVEGGRYVLSAKRWYNSTGSTPSAHEGLVIYHDSLANNKSTLVAPNSPAGLTSNGDNSSAATSVPIVNLMGDVTVTCRPSAASPSKANEKMYKFSV